MFFKNRPQLLFNPRGHTSSLQPGSREREVDGAEDEVRHGQGQKERRRRPLAQAPVPALEQHDHGEAVAQRPEDGTDDGGPGSTC